MDVIYVSFLYIVFTRCPAGKSWSQFDFKILHYIIRLIRYQINLIRFLYEISLTGKTDENDYLYVQNTEAH